jgi:hypothetical protein
MVQVLTPSPESSRFQDIAFVSAIAGGSRDRIRVHPPKSLMGKTIQRAKNLVLMSRYGVFSSKCTYGSSFEKSFPFGLILFKNRGNVKAVRLIK